MSMEDLEMHDMTEERQEEEEERQEEEEEEETSFNNGYDNNLEDFSDNTSQYDGNGKGFHHRNVHTKKD